MNTALSILSFTFILIALLVLKLSVLFILAMILPSDVYVLDVLYPESLITLSSLLN